MDKESQLCQRIIDNVAGVFVGEREHLERILAGVLADGHLLFEDNPGLGKTLLVKALARSVGCEATRVQFTPDILPADILGTKVWNQQQGAFELVRGPIFTHVLLADEINRAPPKTQSALLEAMQERQVTIEGETLHLSKPFVVLATQNPIEQEGTYPLPEAQMDRFLLRMSTGYPGTDADETRILERRVAWQKEDPTEDLEPVTDLESFRHLQETVETGIFVHPDVLAYIASIVRRLREHPDVAVGPSPRGALALLRVARALALLDGRAYVVPDDIKGIAREALAHRTILRMEQILEGGQAAAVVDEVVGTVPAPTRYRAEG